jgi:hypothetical protein
LHSGLKNKSMRICAAAAVNRPIRRRSGWPGECFAQAKAICARISVVYIRGSHLKACWEPRSTDSGSVSPVRSSVIFAAHSRFRAPRCRLTIRQSDWREQCRLHLQRNWLCC